MKNDMDAARRSWQERLEGKVGEWSRVVRDRSGFSLFQEQRIAELNREIQRMMDEFHDLLDVKIQLDTELNTYRMLLEVTSRQMLIFLPSVLAIIIRWKGSIKKPVLTWGGNAASKAAK